MQWRRGATVVLAFGLAVSACGGDDDEGSSATTDGAPTATTAPVETTASTPATTEPEPTDPPTTTEPASTDPPTTPAATEPTAPPTTEPVEGVVLRGDGLGIVSFGEPADDVVDELTARFGEPTEVSDWMATGLPPDGPPPCNFVEQQFVHWGDLVVLNALDPDGSRQFRYYAYAAFEGGEPFPPDLETEAGLGLLDTIESAVEKVPGLQWDVSVPATWRDEEGDLFGELITDRGVLIGSITAGDICAG